MRTRMLFAVCFLLAVVSFVVPKTEADQVQMITTFNSAGYSVSAWVEKIGCELHVFAQMFDPEANPLGDKLLVSEHEIEDNGCPSLGIDALGNWVVTWVGSHGLGKDLNIYFRIYDNLGNPSEVWRIDYARQTLHLATSPIVAMTPSGSFAICWIDCYQPQIGNDLTDVNICCQQFNPDGMPLGEAYRINRECLDCGWSTVGIIREMIVTEQEIAVIYRIKRVDPGSAKTVLSFWADQRPTVSIRYQQEENPGDFVSLTISPTSAGKKYQVYCCDDLSSNIWLMLGEPVIAESNSLTVIDQGGATSSSLRETKSRFYRVGLVP